MSRQSDTRAWYVHPWANIDTKSMLRSRMSRTIIIVEYGFMLTLIKEGLRGRCSDESPVESCANREVEKACVRDADKMASRILVSSFLAIISAALPRGARMKGT